MISIRFNKYLLSLLLFLFWLPVAAQVRDGSYNGARVIDGQPEAATVTIDVLSLGDGVTIYRENKKPLDGCYYFEIHGRRRNIIGNFSKGIAHGEWTEYMYDNVYRKWTFNEGKYEGKVYTYSYGNGAIHDIVTYKNGIRLSATEYHSNGQLKEERIYDNSGKISGEVITYDQEGGVVNEANYLHGKEHGRQMSMDSRGYREISFYNNGEIEGEYIRYYPNGNKQQEGSYDSGSAETGRWRYWSEDGDIQREEHYLNGKLNGERRTYYADKRPQSIEEYTDGKLNGKRIEYHESDKISYEYNYLNGKMDGVFRAYLDGKIWRECIYEEDRIISEKEYKNGKLNILRIIDETGKLTDVQQYDETGKSTYKNANYKKHASVVLKEDSSGIIDIEYNRSKK